MCKLFSKVYCYLKICWIDVHGIIQFDNNTFVIYLYRISIFFPLEDTYERLILEAKTNTKFERKIIYSFSHIEKTIDIPHHNENLI